MQAYFKNILLVINPESVLQFLDNKRASEVERKRRMPILDSLGALAAGVTKMRDVSRDLIIMKVHRDAARALCCLRTLAYHGTVITTTYLPYLSYLPFPPPSFSTFQSLSLSLSHWRKCICCSRDVFERAHGPSGRARYIFTSQLTADRILISVVNRIYWICLANSHANNRTLLINGELVAISARVCVRLVIGTLLAGVFSEIPSNCAGLSS